MLRAMDYPYQYELDVVFRDLDAMGHVNNAVYFTYLETARLRYLMDLLALPEIGAIPVIMANASCVYLSPAHYGERLVIGVGISRLGTKSFDMAYKVETVSGRDVAQAKTIQVMYDYATGQTMAIPEWFKVRIAAAQQDWTIDQ